MKTILIIDDDDSIRENVAEILSIAGYKVLEAVDGISGLKLAKEHRTIDLVLCDVMMPNLDGYGTLKIFNNTGRLNHIPFVFLTAKSQTEDFRQGMGLGAADYLFKPFESVDLLEVIQQRLPKERKLFDASFALDKSLDDWVSECKPLKFLQGEAIFKIGQTITGIYYIKEGFVKTEMQFEGKPYIPRIFRSKDFLGNIPLGDTAQNYYYDAVCITPCIVYRIPKQNFIKSLQTHPASSLALVKKLGEDLQINQQYFSSMVYLSSLGKVAYILRYLSLVFESTAIELPRQDIAALAGLTPETISRGILRLKKDQLISISGKSITINEMFSDTIIFNL